MADLDKVIAWLADTELYYQQEGSISHDSHHQCKMAHDAIELLKSQREEISDLKDRLRRTNYHEWMNC